MIKKIETFEVLKKDPINLILGNSKCCEISEDIILKEAPDKISMSFLLRNQFLKKVSLEQLYMLMYIYNNSENRFYFSMEFFARELRRSSQTISNHFKELADMHLIERIKNKKYYLTKLTKYFYNILGFYYPGEEENIDIQELFEKIYNKGGKINEN